MQFIIGCFLLVNSMKSSVGILLIKIRMRDNLYLFNDREQAWVSTNIIGAPGPRMTNNDQLF